MSSRISYYSELAKDAEAALMVSMESERRHRSTDYNLAEKYRSNAAQWAAIYTACKLIVVEEAEREEENIIKWEAMENDGDNGSED